MPLVLDFQRGLHNPAGALFLKANILGGFFSLAGFVCVCSHIMMAHIPFAGKMPSIKCTPHQFQAIVRVPGKANIRKS